MKTADPLAILIGVCGLLLLVVLFICRSCGPWLDQMGL
jgi:hypothetical protein